VVVKARYVKQTSGRGAKAARLHLKYIERDGVSQDGGEGDLYNGERHGLSSDDFLKRADNDPHQFRFIVSPEDAKELDLTEYTRDLMKQVEADLGRPLDWAAVNHHNTDNPHTHIVIRGQDKHGEELRIDRQYISHGFRTRARELATRELGPRPEHEIEQGLRAEINQERFTSLDVQIDRMAQDNLMLGKVSHEKLSGETPWQSVTLGSVAETNNPRLDPYLVGRLNHLQSMGLAYERAPRSYDLSPDWKARLRALGERGDIIKTMHRALRRNPQHYRIYDAEQESHNLVGRVVSKGAHDELNDRYYAVVETPRGEANYVKLPASTDVGALSKDSIVKVESIADPWRKDADGVIADFAKANGGVYDREAHAASLVDSPTLKQRGIDPQDYALAHSRRAARLQRFGLLTNVGTDRWSVPDDLPDRLAALDREHPNPRQVRMTMLDPRALSLQETARGPAWLDSLTPNTVASHGFGAEVSRSMQRRAAFLRTLGIDITDEQASAKLSRLERETLAGQYGQESGKALRGLKAGDSHRGTLKAQLKAPSGRSYAVFETEHGFSLVPWRERWNRQVGRQMVFGMNAQGIPFAQAPSRGITR